MLKFILPIFILFLSFSCATDEDDNAIVFIGDSLVYGWDLSYSFPQRNTINKGVKGAKIKDAIKWKIDCNNKDCVLLIGTNDLPYISEGESFTSEFKQSFFNDYKQLIESLAADKIIVISVIPRNDIPINNEIRLLNKELEEMLSQYSNVVFIDVFNLFLIDGKFNPGFYTDNIHLNSDGYELLSSTLYKHL